VKQELVASRQPDTTVVNSLRSLTIRISALALLPEFHNLTPAESQRVLELVIYRLDDSEPTVQMEASSALAGLGDVSAIPYLKATIVREKEEAIRSVFELNLEKLEKKAKD
jgi:HEAT repeat protein